MAKRQVDFDTWSLALAETIAAVGQESFPSKVFNALSTLAPHDDPIIWFYPKGEKPFAMDARGQSADAQDIEDFLKGPYLLDPFYLAGVDGIAEGFYRLTDLAPQAFRQSEYYRNYYVRIRMTDEVGYIAYVDDDCFANISFGRNEGRSRFTPSELQLLVAVSGILCQLLRQHMAMVDPIHRTEESADNGLHVHLQSALDHFGASLLTDREQDVIHLFLRGHSTKSAAEKLGISPETIKLHRKNSYAKLDVASQAELFFLFIDSLSHANQQPGEDPLASYLMAPP